MFQNIFDIHTLGNLRTITESMKLLPQYRHRGEAGKPSSRMDAATYETVETDWNSILSSETDLPPDVFSVVKEEERTESRWNAWGTGVPAHCKEEREEGKSGMGKLPHIPDKALAKLTVKQLKKLMQNLGTEEVKALKQRRRTLKNRGYAVQCRLRRQQYKDNLEVQVRQLQVDNCQLQEQLKKCEDERNLFHQYYQYYQTHPFNNNNHEAQDYTRQDGEDMKIDPVDLRKDFDLNGANRGDSTGKLEPGERFRGDQQQSQLVEELLAAGEDPAALGVVWRKEIGQKVCKQLVQEEQVGRGNGYPVVEDELQLVHEHKVVLNLRHY